MNKLPDNIRQFDDYKSIRNNIYSGVLDALENKEVEDTNHRLTLTGVKFKGPETFSLSKQKDALLKNNNLTRTVTGTWTLRDKATNKVIDKRTQPIIRVPVMTERGTIINNGNEYTFTNQSRLKYGVYTRRKSSGEYEAQFNIKPGTGTGFRVWMEPKTGKFKVKVKQGNIPAYQFFKLAGITDDQMKKAWGPALYAVNTEKLDKKADSKIFQNFLSRYTKAVTTEEKIKEFRDNLSKHEVDPYVIESTLGIRGTKYLTPEMLLRSTNKLLNVSKGEEDEDDRDHLRFSTIHSAEDLVRERIDKDAGKVFKNLLIKARYDKNLRRIKNNILDSYMSSLMHSTGLMTPLEETNPVQLLEQANRITKFGEGGIGDDNAIIDSARDVSLSQLGFIDPIAGPESGRIGVDTRAAYKTFKGKDGNLYGEFKDKRGKTVYLTPMDLYGKALAFPGQQPDKNGEVVVSKNDTIQRIPIKEVDYTIPTTGHMLSANLNITNMNTAFQPARAFYSAKYHSQYIPQAHGEVPLVQTAFPGTDSTYQEVYGKKVGALHAPVSGVVTKVTDDLIKIKDSNGHTHEIEAVKNFPFNRMSLTGDQKVFIQRNRAVFATRINAYTFITGDLIMSYDPNTKKSAWKPIYDFICHKNTKRLYEIKFRSGRSVKITEDHSLLALNKDWELTPILPLDCIIGSTRCPIVFNQVELEGNWTYNNGVLDGLYLSEGYRAKKQKGLVSIAVKPKERVAYVKDLVTSLGGCPHDSKENCSWTDHKRWSRWEKDFGDYSAGKYIANHVYSRGTLYLKGLIAGYCGGDGCLWQDVNNAIQLECSTISRQLRDDLVGVLQLLGIYTYLHGPSYNGKNCADIYHLRVRSTDICKLDYWFCYKDRQAKLDRLITDKYRACDSDHLEFNRTSRTLVYKSLSKPLSHFIYKSATCGKIAKYRLKNASGIPGAWANSDILWDTISEINHIDTEDKVYDFSVEESEAFATYHGLLVHNTAISYTPSVKVGDRVGEGDMVASSNFIDSKTGALNTGQNLSIAIMPYKGMSFEDAYVISENAAKKLTTEKMFEKKQDTENDNNISKHKYMSLFPSEFSNKQLDTIDDTGIVKKGLIVHKGDPIILSTRPKTMSTQDKALGKLHKVLSQGNVDTSITWDHDAPGEVIDVAKTRKGIWKVNIKSVSPASVGDKLCFTPGHELYTTEGWVKVEDLKPDMITVTRIETRAGYISAGIKISDIHVYDVDEDIYVIDTDKISLEITENHKMYIQYINIFYDKIKVHITKIAEKIKRFIKVCHYGTL